MEQSIRIELLYFDGCPTYRSALKDLEAVIDEEGVQAHTELILVKSDDDAARLQFLGSPTIRVNGVDVEQPARSEREYKLSCRIYRENGKMRSSPSREVLRRAIRSARS